jgi:hypothetical protein
MQEDRYGRAYLSCRKLGIHSIFYLMKSPLESPTRYTQCVAIVYLAMNERSTGLTAGLLS